MPEPPPPPSPAGGIPFGRYLIRKRLAKGGMGEVFLADQLGPLGPVRPVALKRMLPRLANEPRAARMFLDEIATAAQLNHPHIATTYDFGEVEGVYYIAMEYVDGLPLSDLIAKLGPLPIDLALLIVATVAEALEYAHNRKLPSGELAPVVHRDVTPHNVMISGSGAVKLLDFGIARAEAAVLGGRLEGKLAYAAPEQLQGAPADRRSDLWALGVLLYEAITGSRPFAAEAAVPTLIAAMDGDYPPVESRRPEAAGISPLVVRSLSPDPAQRWSTAEELRGACLAAMSSDGGGVAALSELVVRAGGPRKSSVGVESFTQSVMMVPRGLSATVDVHARTAPRVEAPAPAFDESDVTAKHPSFRSAGRAMLLGGVLAALAITAGVAWFGATDEEVTPLAPIPATTAALTAVSTGAPATSTTPARVELAAEPEPSAPSEDDHRSPHLAPAHPAPRPTKAHAHRVEPPPPPPPLKAEHGLGLLSVRAVPWARVALDGRPLGSSPLANVPVAEGAHTLTLTPGSGSFEVKSTKIKVRSGVALRVQLNFENGALTVEDEP